MKDATVILSTLTPENADDWQLVGKVMHELNGISEIAPTGGTWHDVLLETLAERGKPISSGHLHRIRRAFDFLKNGMVERRIPKERAALAKISSLDQAERLFQLDHEAGLDALEACLDVKNPATKTDIQKLYESYLANHPEKKTPMQVAWERRRLNQAKPTFDETHSMEADAGSITTMLRKIGDYVSGLETAAKEDAARIAELEQEVSDIKAELIETKQSFHIVLDDYNEMKTRRDAGW
jgi:hypothetical protein